jgi:hypothetical protein
MSIGNKLVYPIFLQCCDLTEDNFWKYIFEDLAYLKTPYGIYIQRDYICCNFKGKEFNYKIDTSKSPNILFKEIYNLFNKKFELLSEKDKKNRRNLFECDTIHNANILFKKFKYELIIQFVLRMKKQWNLAWKSSKKLLSYIILGLMLKILTKTDINFSNCEIESINGISFEDKKIIYKNTLLRDINITSALEIIIEKKLSYLWVKYINKLN